MLSSFNIIFFCERLPHFSFFLRFAQSLAENDYNVFFLSNRLSVVLAAQQEGCQALFLRGEYDSSFPSASSGGSFEDFSTSNLATVKIDKCLSRLNAFYLSTLKPLGQSAYFFWNGSSLLARALSTVVRDDGNDTLFFELGNFPGKVFVDPEGVNAKSWFFRNYQELADRNIDMKAFYSWRANYLENKMSKHVVQQASVANKFNWFYPLDVFGFYCLSAPYSEPPDMLGRTWRYFRSRIVQYDYDEIVGRDHHSYVFFPLQVSTDSQLLVNSDIDNLEGVRQAMRIAQSEGASLIVKPHPAEGNRAFVEKLASLRAELGFKFVDGNTFELMAHSSRVVTINSTAGMEAMLLDKPVTVLGRAIYEKFSIEDLAYYIMEYLFDIDYFSNKPISSDFITKLIARMKMTPGL